MTTAAETTAENTRKERDNPAHAVLRHLAGGPNAEAVKTAIREVTIERLESNGAVAGLAALRAELFGAGTNGGAASRAEPAGGTARSGSRRSRAVQQELPLEKPKEAEDEDEDVEEEEVEDDEEDESDDEEEEETPAPDEEDERTPLRRSVSRAGRGSGGRKGRRGK